ncbi:pantetheine-phosphate adenylyltransferase [Taibaiella chishuiensis]|uniref:Phosphopantetheine adenylyltransferase n=1 Tax=Taibaiella chishuiensis TaxID=1434707 RepID=A0A2P8D3X9_9BACT|nr:pantetheine-phosphate adenylyltransferase [Taibaiella chishuiensis]PSK91917.1 phosphopantetheine adenylyltransferase [Taibaiella chishuiensis]
MQRTCLFPGSFDPVTKGHIDIIQRSVALFDKLVIGVGINSNKQPMFSAEQRVGWIREVFAGDSRIEVVSYEGLTVDFCRKIGAQFILRGVRYVSDFEYEKAIADMNRMLESSVETIFLPCTPEYSTISSTLVRDVIRNGGNVDLFIPKEVKW